MENNTRVASVETLRKRVVSNSKDILIPIENQVVFLLFLLTCLPLMGEVAQGSYSNSMSRHCSQDLKNEVYQFSPRKQNLL